MTGAAPTAALQETLDVLRERQGTPLTTAEVADRLGLERRSCYYRLDRLAESGLVDTKQVGANGRIWWCHPDEHGPPAGLEGLLCRTRDGDPVGVLALDASDTVVYANETVARYFGVEREALLDTDEEACVAMLGADVAAPGSSGETNIEDGPDGPVCTARGEDGTERLLERQERPIESGPYAGGRLVRYYPVTGRRAGRSRQEMWARQQAALTELGDRATAGRDLDRLLDDAVELVADTLDAAYCEVLELRSGGEQLQLQAGVGWDPDCVGSATVSTDRASQADYTLRSAAPVVVADLSTESRFSPPDLLLEHGVESGISVTIGPETAPWGVLGVHDTTVREFDDQDARFVGAVANVLAMAVTRRGTESDLEAEQSRLSALNELNELVRETTGAIFQQSTREEVERVVCERLAESDQYLFAWIGSVDNQTSTVRPRTAAGVGDYLDDVTISVDPEDERSQGPTGQAVLSREPHVASDVGTGPMHEPWREHVREYGFEASAAIPILHGDSLYGVLNVYTERENAFTDEEVAELDQLGEVVGQVIASLERKRALTSDDLVELVAHFPDIYETLDVPVYEDPITLDDVVPIGDGHFLQYGTTTRRATAVLDGLTAELSYWIDWEVLEEGPEEVEFQIRLSRPPALTRVARFGAEIAGGVIQDGDFRLRLRLPYDADVNEVLEEVRDEYPDVRVVARRQIHRNATSEGRLRGVLQEDLTERQRTVLEVAYRSGFFEWPRRGSAADIAGLLDINASTFTEHIRKAENRLFGVLFEPSGARDRDEA